MIVSDVYGNLLKDNKKERNREAFIKNPRPTHRIRDFKTETQQRSKDTNPTLEI